MPQRPRISSATAWRVHSAYTIFNWSRAVANQSLNLAILLWLYGTQ
jgi:hypothetical protein